MIPPSDERMEQIKAFLDRHDLPVEPCDLIAQALVHRSFAYENQNALDNERLEFLGDAILGSMTAQYLYQTYENEHEGDLSKRKAFLVSREELARRSLELGLDQIILLGRGEESSGGRKRTSIVGSALEALIGALYFTLPYQKLSDFVWDKILKPGEQTLANQSHPDYKSRLQELVQKSGRAVPEYKKIDEEGPAHDKFFVVEVRVENRHVGTGTGPRIKTAENCAARQAYESLAQDPNFSAPPSETST